MRGILLLLSIIGAGTNYQPTTLLVPPYRHTLGYNRANKFYLSLYLGGPFQFKDPQDLTAVKLTMYDDTTTRRDDDEVTIFAVHSGAAEIIYNVEFKRLERYGEQGPGSGQFNQPMGIAATPAGDVYVADAGNNRVVHLKYEEDGSLTWKGTVGSGLNHPTDVDTDSKGAIYIADEGNNRVVVLEPSGAVRSVWKRELFKPRSLAVIDRDAPYNDAGAHFVAVIDNRQKRLSMFDLYGDLKTRITNKEMGYEKVKFANLDIDRSGSIYLTDMYNHQVHKFDKELHYIISLGREGSDDYEFYSPRGITINPPTGQVFIAEAEGGQYYWIGADGFIVGCYPNPFPSDQGTTISIYLTETANLTVEIYDEEGLLVRKLSGTQRYEIGEALLAWDGRDEDGEQVIRGRYTLKVLLKPVNISRRYLTKELQTTVLCKGPSSE